MTLKTWIGMGVVISLFFGLGVYGIVIKGFEHEQACRNHGMEIISIGRGSNNACVDINGVIHVIPYDRP